MDTYENRTEHHIEQLRVPPQSVEAEQSVLGALMLDPDCLDTVSAIVSADDFIRRDHRLIFTAIRELANNGDAVDAVTLGEWFEAKGEAELVAGGAYLIELASTTPSAANAVAYARIVRDKAGLRAQIEAGTEIVNSAFTANGNAGEVYSANVARLAELLPRITSDEAEPLDMFGETDPCALQPEWLPPVVARVAFDLAEVMGSAPEILAMTGIATAAAACHDDFRLQPKPTEPKWTEPARLWTMIVANPGTKKSPAMKRMLSPLLDINANMVRRYVAERSKYDDEARQAKMLQREVEKRRAKGAAGDTVGMDEDVEIPPPPRKERCIVGDATVEALADLMVDNPRGLTFYRDELSGWFGSMDAYSKGAGAKDRPKLLETFEGGSQTIDRVGRGVSFVENWSMGVIGSTQPDKVRALVAKSEDDGLFARFLIVEVPEGYRPSANRAADDAAYKAYCHAIESLWSTKPGIDGSGTISLCAEAQAVCLEFIEWADRIAASEGLPSMLRNHLSKYTGLWCRLVVAYHCLGCAANGLFPSRQLVAKATVERVTKLMKRYLLPQAMRFYGDTASEGDRMGAHYIAKQAASMILANNLSRLSRRDMQRVSKGWRDGPEWSKRSVIDLLTSAGWLMAPDTQRKSGGNETGWTVNPKVHKLFAEKAASEKIRRARVAEGLAELKRAAKGAP